MATIKPKIPKGTRDFSSEEIFKRNYIKKILISVFEIFGYEPIETPSFEKLETLIGQYGDEGDRLIFKIMNSGEKVKKADFNSLEKEDYEKFSRSISEKALRYDLTVPFARYVSQNQNKITFPFKRYQIQPVWRADRPQHGRFQEFFQCDADIIGNYSLWQEIEMILLYDEVFSRLNLKGVKIRINHRKVLSAICSIFEISDRFNEFTAISDKIDKIGVDGVINEFEAKNFPIKAIAEIKSLFKFSGSITKKLKFIEKIFEDYKGDKSGLDEISFILKYIDKTKLKVSTIDFDFSLARGLNYYTGMIIEVSPPSAIKIGSIGGGGRYDNLTSKFGLKNISGIGISFGFERIYFVLESLKLFPKNIKKHTNVLFLNFGNELVENIHSEIDKLRINNISCELYPSNEKLKKQLSYANKKEIPFVVLIGPEEFKEKKFILKNMISGDQLIFPIKELYDKIKEMVKN